jgi:hypothetical protein
MRRSSTFRRITGGLYLAVAIALSCVMPIAEARADAAVATAVAHIESPDGSGKCPPAHDHLTCTVCRALRLLARAEPAAHVEIVAGSVASPATYLAWRTQFARGATAHPRAPPTA